VYSQNTCLLRENHGLRESASRVLRRISGLVRETVEGRWTKRLKKELKPVGLRFAKC
jgi:hypothetical protein